MNEPTDDRPDGPQVGDRAVLTEVAGGGHFEIYWIDPTDGMYHGEYEDGEWAEIYLQQIAEIQPGAALPYMPRRGHVVRHHFYPFQMAVFHSWFDVSGCYFMGRQIQDGVLGRKMFEYMKMKYSPDEGITMAPEFEFVRYATDKEMESR